jgi:hypothetical protein
MLSAALPLVVLSLVKLLEATWSCKGIKLTAWGDKDHDAALTVRHIAIIHILYVIDDIVFIYHPI